MTPIEVAPDATTEQPRKKPVVRGTIHVLLEAARTNIGEFIEKVFMVEEDYLNHYTAPKTPLHIMQVTVSSTKDSPETVSATVRVFLDNVYRLSSKNEKHRAIDATLVFMDRALVEGSLPLCNRALEKAEAHKLSASLIVSFLGITRPAKAQLPARVLFYEKAMNTLVAERGRERAERLLKKYE